MKINKKIWIPVCFVLVLFVCGYVSTNSDLFVDKNLIVAGNFTGNRIYAEMHFHNDTDGNVTPLTEDVWNNVTAFDQPYNGQFPNGFTYASSILIADIDGLYDSFYSVSFTGTVNNKYHSALAVNGEVQFGTESHDRISTGSDVLGSTGGGYLQLNVGDEVALVLMNEDSGGDATVLSANVNLEEVGT